jgi:hypothetical protein
MLKLWNSIYLVAPKLLFKGDDDHAGLSW